MMNKMKYSAGYKYILREPFTLPLAGHWPKCGNNFVRITSDGQLLLREGYAWDGVSGPVADTKINMRGGLVHDALYQLLRNDILPREYQIVADIVAKNIWIEDGMWAWQAGMYYRVLRTVSPFTAKKPREVLHAP